MSEDHLVVDKNGEKNNDKPLIYGNTGSTLYIVMASNLPGKFSYKIRKFGLG